MHLVYSAAILLSAFLLFTIQLMIGKALLPYFGGSPSVWNTSMMFYQILLLAGYVYAHILGTKVLPRWQPVLHGALFAASLVLLTFILNPADLANASTHPISTQLAVMTAMVGLPFFVLSATAPLIQRWFFLSLPERQDKVYLLYATSNLGSFLALLSYPALIEPLMTLSTQETIWRWLQMGLFALFIIGGIFLARSKSVKENPSETKTIPLPRVLWWILLAFLPSSLSLGVTMKITTDIASIPLLWVIPLALYLLTFVVAFRDRPVLPLQKTFSAVIFLVLLHAALDLHPDFGSTMMNLTLALGTFFLLAFLCHRILYEDRPKAENLTFYYIILSVGGALGGIFNSLIVPNIMVDAYEFPLILLVALVATGWKIGVSIPRILSLSDLQKQVRQFFNLPPILLLLASGIPVLFGQYWFYRNEILWLIGTIAVLFSLIFVARHRSLYIALTALILLFPTILPIQGNKTLYTSRNYFGVKRVIEGNGLRHFIHGTTNHGSQILEEKYAQTPITYYNPTGAAADLFKTLEKLRSRPSVLILGLGIAGLSCHFNQPGNLTFIEIDPDVVHLARDSGYFSFLKRCGGDEKIIVGDGRLELSKMPDRTYDMLFMDAFSSDSIPFHLLTRDAVGMYLSKLKDDGFLVFHISNRYFDLSPELMAIARDLNLSVLQRKQVAGMLPGTKYQYTGSKYLVMARPDNTHLLNALKSRNAAWKTPIVTPPQHAWTDDYLNVMRAIKWLRKPEKPDK